VGWGGGDLGGWGSYLFRAHLAGLLVRLWLQMVIKKWLWRRSLEELGLFFYRGDRVVKQWLLTN